MKISIKECLHQYAAGLTKNWQHDRLNTVGASEIGSCLRKTWFSKNEAPADQGYVDRYGAKLRGNLIEDHYVIPGLRASLRNGVSLLYAGADQRTLVDGYLSATPDGILAGLENGCLNHLGVDDIGESGCLALEIKSIDPRVDLRVEKPEHSFQTQAQMGLLRHATEYQPAYALISYVDASFLDDIKEFVVKFDPTIYQAAKDRARRIMTETDALALPPEGKLSGGSECKSCAWASHCVAVTVAGIPKADDVVLGDNAMAMLKQLRDDERDIALCVDEDTATLAQVRERIKESLRTHGVRRVNGEGWSISYSSVKGRETVDTKAAEAAGIDLSAFRKVGDPADRLTVK